MNVSPLVTIAISTHDRSEKYIRECLESVLNQSYKHLEIIVADDASTTVDVNAIVKSYGDARVRYHRHPENIGVVKNFTWCIQQAKGEWVNIFHDDDIMMPHNVLNMVAEAQRHPQVNFQFSEAISIDGAGKEIEELYWSLDIPKASVYPGSFWIEFLFSQFANKICAPSVFIKRDIYLKHLPFSSSPTFTTDLNMWLRVLSSPGVFCLMRKDYGVRYRVHPQQATVSQRKDERRCLLIEFGRIFPALSFNHKVTYLKKILKASYGYCSRRIKYVPDLSRSIK